MATAGEAAEHNAGKGTAHQTLQQLGWRPCYSAEHARRSPLCNQASCDVTHRTLPK